jgi:DNA-binding SARP family transcriptional activator
VALAAGRLVVYKRKPGRDPDGPESDVSIRDGFAEVDPVENLARRVAHTSDPASAIASLLGQAYAAIFDEVLQPGQRRDIHDVTVDATRHGRSSTTLVLAAPVTARPYFVHHMRAAAERAFGDQVDVDGKVDQDGDVLVRVTWDVRHPISGNLLEHVNDSSARCAWPTPCLVPVLDLYDRQRMAINWHTLSGVLIAAPTGQGADVPLVALVAALASLRAPEDLGLVIVARPHTLPDEIGELPHGLMELVDPGDPEAVLRALEGTRLEVDRRRQSGSADDADVVVVLRELGDLEPEALAVCAAIAATGPQYGVRLVAASQLPVAELLRSCSFVDQFGSRLLLQTASEEDSVALVGVPGAERLGAGGHALLRFEGRVPHPGWAHLVSADGLAGLLHMMGTRAHVAPAAPGEQVGASPDQAADSQPPQVAENDVKDATPPDVEEAAKSSTAVRDNERVRPREAVPAWASRLLRELRAAPIRVRCFGACEVRHGDRLLKLGDPELLLLLAVHPVAGITSDTVADMLWDEDNTPPDPAGSVRKERSKLRLALRRLVPDLPADPLPGNAYHGEKVVTLDTSIVASDVHEFVELLDLAHGLGHAEAIEAYEAALALYRGDLLDAADMRKYRWMYDADQQIALGRRAELRALHKAARLKLAGLLADGPESGLARAEQLYSDLCGEDLDNEHLWTALFRIYERTSSSLGLESAVRRLRDAQVELGTTDVTDIDRVPLPANLEKLAQQIRQRIGGVTAEPPAGGD